MIDTEHLEKTETGTLIIGTTGEKVVNFFDFIAVFKTPQEYTVKHGNQTIGTVDQEYSLGDAFALGGLNWKVIEINDKSHVLFVEPIVGYAETKWRSRCIFITHTKIMQTIREILLSDEPYPFLNESAAELLAVTRNFIRRTETAEKPLHKISSDQWALYPWLGTKAVNALYAWFTAHDLGCKIHYCSGLPLSIIFDKKITDEQIRDEYKRLLASDCETLSVPPDIDYVLPDDKYDQYIPSSLLLKEWIEDYTDVEEVRRMGNAFVV